MTADDSPDSAEPIESAASEAPAQPQGSGDEFLDRFAAAIPEAHVEIEHGQRVAFVAASAWSKAIKWCFDQGFLQLSDICAVDHALDLARLPRGAVQLERFEVVANLLDLTDRLRMRIVAEVPESAPKIASVTDLYWGAAFPERETYDLFGIEFEGHPELTRILLPDDWQGFPLRKDAPSARIPVQFKGAPKPV